MFIAAQHQRHPMQAVLPEPFMQGQPVRVRLVWRRLYWRPQRLVESMARFMDWQRRTRDSLNQSFFKIYDDGKSIDSVASILPGPAGLKVTHEINLARALRPGGGAPSTVCTLCRSVIVDRFMGELWMNLGRLNLYFNPFPIWAATRNGDPLQQPFHVMATWARGHRSQRDLADRKVIREFRRQWMRVNAAFRSEGLPLFRMLMNGWTYGDNPKISGGASQDHVHAHWVRKAFGSEQAPVEWVGERAGVRIGIAELIPGADTIEDPAYTSLVLEARVGAVEQLDDVLAEALSKIITDPERHSFDVFFFETEDGAIRAHLTGRLKAVPSGAKNMIGNPEVLGLADSIEDLPERFYDLSPEQIAALNRIPVQDRLAWLRDPSNHVLPQHPDRLLAAYRKVLQETAYSPAQVDALARSLVTSGNSGVSNHKRAVLLRRIKEAV